MPPLIIDVQEIVMAFEDHDLLQRHYLDRESGEVVSLHEVYSDEDAWEPLAIEPERYLRIEPLASSDSYKVMRDFVETLAARPRPGRTDAGTGGAQAISTVQRDAAEVSDGARSVV